MTRPGIAYISGGTSGIGLALGRRYVARGFDVLAFSVDDEERRELARAVLEQARQGREQELELLGLDVTDAARVDELLGEACGRLGAPSVLLNSAGLGGALPFEEIPRERFERTMAVNVTGVRNTIAACLPHMARGARIINVASMSGLLGSYGYTMYSASKFALVGFSEALRSELAPRGIQVSVACPVQVDTPMLEETNRYKPAETLALNRKVGVISAEATAAEILQGAERGRFLIIPGRKGRLVHLLHRVAPGLRERIADRVIRKVRG